MKHSVKMFIKQKRLLCSQILFTALAFILMVALSYLFASNIVNNELTRYAESVYSFAQARIEYSLQENKTKLGTFAQSLRDMIIYGDNSYNLRNYVNDMASYMQRNETSMPGSNNLFVYFEAFPEGPVLVSSSGWEPPVEYEPTERPWYAAARTSGDNVVESVPYFSMLSGYYVITYARNIFDDKGRRLGIACLDVPMDEISKDIVETALDRGGYGMLFSQDLTVIAHANPDYVGLSWRDPSVSSSALVDQVLAGIDVSRQPYTNWKGEETVAYIRMLPNGWYLGLLTPKGPFRQSVTNMMYILCGLGATLAAALIYILIRIDAAKKKSDNENRQKSVFLAKMSHEIRTPMNAIIGMAELALREDDLNSARGHIFTVKQAGANLLSIINDVLDFSKIESGTLNIVSENYLFSSMINDVVSIIRMKTVDTKIKFAVNVDSNIPNALIGDEIRIRQILINLLGNAVKYTDKGFVSLTIHAEITDINNINLTMEVKDSGRGIKQENMDELFNEYFQADKDFTGYNEGVGLGLAITYSLVRAMNGSISVSSEYGVGSVFTVMLPQKIYDKEKIAVVEAPEKEKVLLYEESEIYANSVVFSVENLGVQCTVVLNDADFYEKLSSDIYTFVFISFALYERNRGAITTSETNAKVVLLTEFGESITEKGVNALAMPVYSVSIANILNGDTDSFDYRGDFKSVTRFTAPEARILIVDDVQTNLKVAKGLLLPYMMQVELAGGGVEAIEKLKLKNYDLVFMDHRMPDMDGIEATERLRAMGKEDPYYKSLPIIALTANAVSGMREIFLKNGFNDYISKPIDTVKLNSILDKWVPRAKRKHSAPLLVSTNTSKELKIEGLDVNIGIAATGGTVGYYLETLSTFCEDGIERINKIKKCLATGNLPLYTTYLHALKSAAANMGANRLSEMAKNLEEAGKLEDLAYIEKHTGEFVYTLESLILRIREALSAHGLNSDDEKEPVDVKKLKAALLTLKKAFDNMDLVVMNRAVDDLIRLPKTEETAATVSGISNNILMAEYDEAAELIDSLLKEI